jgi:CBS domain-containing protein
MKTAGELVEVKGHDVWSVAPDISVYEALKVMAEKDVGVLLVVERGRLVGTMSERDYARKIILRGRSSVGTPVRDIMTPKVISIRPEQTMEECMTLMTSLRIRHLPVVDENRLIGMVSIGDVVKEVLASIKSGRDTSKTTSKEGQGPK